MVGLAVKVTMTVSFASSRASFTILAIVIAPEVSPAAMVNEPFASVKSVPEPVAVPDIV